MTLIRNYFTLLSMICISNFCFSQEYALEWVKHFAGQYNVFVRSVTTDGNGDVYIAGSFGGLSNFMILDKGRLDSIITHSSLYVSNELIFYFGSITTSASFIAKFEKCGNLIWIKKYDGPVQFNKNKSIKVDKDGNIVVIG